MNRFFCNVLIALGLLSVGASSLAMAQPAYVYQAWVPQGRTSLSVNTGSLNVAVPANGNIAYICNRGSVDAFINFGTTNAVTATTTAGYTVETGLCHPYHLNGTGTPQKWIAGITASNSTTLSIETGSGTPWASSGSASSGGGSNSQLPASLGAKTGAASLSIVPASDATFPASESGTWIIQPGNTPNTVPWLMQPSPGPSGGLTFSTLTAANSTNATNLKSTPGQLYHITAYNNSPTLAWVSFYNTAGTPTCGTSIVYQMMIPANSTSGAGAVDDIPSGLTFTTGIGYCVTTGIGATGSVAAGAYVVNFGFK